MRASRGPPNPPATTTTSCHQLLPPPSSHSPGLDGGQRARGVAVRVSSPPHYLPAAILILRTPPGLSGCPLSMADALLRCPAALSTAPSSLHVLPRFACSPAGASLRLKLTRKLCFSDAAAASVFFARLPKRLSHLKVHAVVTENDEPKWWEKNAGPNMIDVHSTEEFISALSQAGDKLVIVEFYGTWCGSCRALFPKLCRTAQENPDIVFVKVNFDENKPMCKRLNVRVLPYFHFYRGADGQLESFSCSLAKFQKLKDAIAKHNTARCSIGPPVGVGELKELLEASAPTDKPAGASSR